MQDGPDFLRQANFLLGNVRESVHRMHPDGDRRVRRSEKVKALIRDSPEQGSGNVYRCKNSDDVPFNGIVNSRFQHFFDHRFKPRSDQNRMRFRTGADNPRSPLCHAILSPEKKLHELLEACSVGADPRCDPYRLALGMLSENFSLEVHGNLISI